VTSGIFDFEHKAHCVDMMVISRMILNWSTQGRKDFNCTKLIEKSKEDLMTISISTVDIVFSLCRNFVLYRHT